VKRNSQLIIEIGEDLGNIMTRIAFVKTFQIRQAPLIKNAGLPNHKP
jgi:hypothetical protein